MQKPHCSAWCSRNASCSGELATPASPSTVSISQPSACTARSEARADRDAVEADGAGAADAVLAADVRAGQPERVTQEVGEQQPRLDELAVAAAVDGDLDVDHAPHCPLAAHARRRARP